MMFTNAFGLLASFGALAAALPTALEQRDTNSTGGGVEIINNMGKNIYLCEPWKTNSNGGGISIKLSTTPDQADVLQYEYTLSAPTIFWDLSCINDNGACPSATCKPGDTACADAYLFPTDDHATHGCPDTVQMTLNLGPSSAE
ncbi:hypothetical protein BGW36DRAFT_83896 [Talaromyces proteolyticus]|uniref:Uncharacterized protein n=1 Tax=Talaromyces proteolyticus TaxID=1131652 RepID=A0AAD4Q217_9EURO|nr:uncharacterized protein BGW36DRAFT_83896 [Talaromyces proteolyticus]KAH8703202.1 hypothetical protein BGW36DRAFT_83896 [Talaromyces proteolyticus]